MDFKGMGARVDVADTEAVYSAMENEPRPKTGNNRAWALPLTSTACFTLPIRAAPTSNEPDPFSMSAIPFY